MDDYNLQFVTVCTVQQSECYWSEFSDIDVGLKVMIPKRSEQLQAYNKQVKVIEVEWNGIGL